MHYVGFVHVEDGVFGLSFPDAPGCIASEATLDGVLRAGCEALAFHFEGLRDSGDAIPAPRTIDAIEADATLSDWRQGAALVLVPLLTDQGSPRRINITMDPGLLQAVDAAAKARGINRSAFLASAARKEVSGTW